MPKVTRRVGVMESRKLDNHGSTYRVVDPSPNWTAWERRMPSQKTLDAAAERVMQGLHRAPRGARLGNICPACGLMRSRAGFCDCNS